jgi:hypothetical protein
MLAFVSLPVVGTDVAELIGLLGAPVMTAALFNIATGD